MRARATARALFAAGGVVLLAGFHQPASFEASAADGGGHRVYFVGSPRQKRYDCTACHTEPARQITAKIDVTPAVTGAYQAGTTYTIQVALVGEHLGFGTANNQNGFVAELVDDTGTPAGTLASPDTDKVATIDDGRVVSGEGKDSAMWSFQWTAPSTGRGAVTLHLGLVDGNGAASSAVPQNDPGGDDVAVMKLRLCEAAPGCTEPAPPATTASRASGCSAGQASSPPVVLVLLALLGLCRRRRAAVLALALAGCFAPTTPNDCPDHVCGGTGSGDVGSTCKESWVCSSWEAPPGSDLATRTCADKNNLGTTECKPATAATLPALDLEYYKCRVSPIVQRGCGQLACHGTETERAFRLYTRGRLRNKQMVFPVNTCLENPNVKVDLQVRGSGTVMCEGWSAHTPEEWKKNFDSARSFMLGVERPDDSLLLREPAQGGLPHAQGKLFAAGDPDYQTIAAWLGGAKLGTTCNTGKN
jgi:MYXO-CTERM domain-containing protein